MDADREVCDSIRYREFRCWRVNKASAIALALRTCVAEAKADESARFERARSEARTNWDGLFEGQRFDMIAGKTEAACKGGRKGGPPDVYGQQI
jgi:hypothetical protein